jgi:hypothetical protein
VRAFESSLGKFEKGNFQNLVLKILVELFENILGEIMIKEDFIGKSRQSIAFVWFVGYYFKRIGLVGLEKLTATSSSFKIWKDLGKNTKTHF